MTEPPLMAAGRWIDRHSPADARVLTYWGHPAYASQRFVYDGSFLNRRPEPGSLLLKYSPEVLVKQRGERWRLQVPEGYRAVRSFSPPPPVAQPEKALMVLFRADVPVSGDAGDEGEDIEPAEQVRAKQRAAVARILFQRLLDGKPVSVGRASEEVLEKLELETSRTERWLAGLSEEKRRAVLEKRPGLGQVSARVAELRQRKQERTEPPADGSGPEPERP